MKNKNAFAKGAWCAGVALIFVGAVWVPFYNSVEPSVAGIPFFYWFQFLWIIVTAIVTGLAYRARM